MTGMWLALMVIATAGAFGLLWRARQGRVRSASKLPPPVLPEQVLHRVDAEAAVTLLQLTTPICARCPPQSQRSGTPSWTSPSTRSWPAC